MEFNRAKLETMLAEHKGRGGELEALLGKYLDKLSYPLSEEDFKEIFNRAGDFYKHVGAIWVLEGILHEKTYSWRRK